MFPDILQKYDFGGEPYADLRVRSRKFWHFASHFPQFAIPQVRCFL